MSTLWAVSGGVQVDTGLGAATGLVEGSWPTCSKQREGEGPVGGFPVGGVVTASPWSLLYPFRTAAPPAPVLSAQISVPELVWATYPQTRPQWASCSLL